MPLEKITIQNRYGYKLAGRLHRPDGEKAYGWCVYAHCFSCSKDIKLARNMCEALARQGIGALRFDFTGVGESEGTFEQTTFTHDVEDILDARQFLQEHYGEPSLLVGHSLGGTATLAAAARLARGTEAQEKALDVVAAINAPSTPQNIARHFDDLEQELAQTGKACMTINGKSYYFDRSFFQDVATYDMPQLVKHIDAHSVIFHSPIDTVVPRHNAERLYADLPYPKSMISLPEVDHLVLQQRDAAHIAQILAVLLRQKRRL